MGGRALTIRTDLPAEELRRLARREKDRAAAARLPAIAGALEGLPRAEAARLAGMERQGARAGRGGAKPGGGGGGARPPPPGPAPGGGGGGGGGRGGGGGGGAPPGGTGA